MSLIVAGLILSCVVAACCVVYLLLHYVAQYSYKRGFCEGAIASVEKLQQYGVIDQTRMDYLLAPQEQRDVARAASQYELFKYLGGKIV